MAHPTLSKAIADVGWGELLRQVDYKAAWYGRTLIKIDRWYPSSKTCSACGLVLEHLDLDEREWTCPQCGTHRRDHGQSVGRATPPGPFLCAKSQARTIPKGRMTRVLASPTAREKKVICQVSREKITLPKHVAS